MNYVEPLRQMDKIHDISEYLRCQSERNYLLFLFGIYTGLRISDILQLKVKDVSGKEQLIIREIKTNKDKRIEIHPDLKKIIKLYIKGMKDYEYLFKSAKGNNQPITRVQAYRILNDAAKYFGISSIGTHTLRKTFGYHLYCETKDSILVMKALNHSDPSITLRYIGIENDTVNKAIKKMSFI